MKYYIGIPCIINKLTGLYCPGCGATRAVISLIKLDIYQAFRYNMLIVTILPFAIIYLFYKYILNGKWKIPNFLWYFLAIVTVLYGILRNMPYFSFLAPTEF